MFLCMYVYMRANMYVIVYVCHCVKLFVFGLFSTSAAPVCIYRCMQVGMHAGANFA
jgi:hypothetical protein